MGVSYNSPSIEHSINTTAVNTIVNSIDSINSINTAVNSSIISTINTCRISYSAYFQIPVIIA